ncbi:MAG: helix-turn-helix domain-containing protein, partial [Pseudomonadota bacterium]
AFATSPKFASNLVAVLHDQATHSLQYTTSNDDGLRRLSASLLSRSTPSGDRKRQVVATQSQLAAETGLSRQWVNRLLKELEKRGLAECGRGHIVLHSPSRLEALPVQY